ncbi:MAG TPA: hypothetical protein VK254_04250 [Candidatus Bathyarchaeia archaeon]|nr:hypothetical protein [Candidatus Bathyarchaeia archaeon]
MNQKYSKTAKLAFPIATYDVNNLAWTIGLLIASVIFPALLAHSPQNQWITGTIVNAVIFLAVWRFGVVNAAFVAILPSSIALLRGLLPVPMAIMIPWIIISNFILIAAFFSTKKYPLAGIVLASTAKFFFLFAVATYFLKISSPFLFMFQWPQLVTALAGGLVALGTLKIYQKLAR